MYMYVGQGWRSKNKRHGFKMLTKRPVYTEGDGDGDREKGDAMNSHAADATQGAFARCVAGFCPRRL